MPSDVLVTIVSMFEDGQGTTSTTFLLLACLSICAHIETRSSAWELMQTCLSTELLSRPM